MFVVSVVPDEAALPAARDGQQAAHGIYCTFNGCRGFYHAAGGSIGVVLCAPWGFEDLSMRKGWRLLAEAIAAAGYPCLRFDYPGTGDSLGAATDVRSVAEWVGSINAAADRLRKITGVRRFVFIGQSLGATLAIEAARTRGDVVGLQLVATILKGRPYVRELMATATLVADRIGIETELTPDEGLSVLGFSLSPAMIESLKALDLTKIETLGVDEVVVYDQPDRKAGFVLANHLRRLGARVDMAPVAPFHVMVSDATAIQPLPVPVDTIVDALRARHPLGRAIGTPIVPALPSVLVAGAFAEEPVRFGMSPALFGLVCTPVARQVGAPAVILLNRGLNSHIGWRRSSVDHARGLAAAGITSLRFDVAGLGESRDEAGRPVNLIYSDLLLPDIKAAVDLLVSRGHRRIALVGVCSGAYMALNAAYADPRITDVVAANPQRFVWNPAENVDEVIRYGLRSMNDYVGDIRSRLGWRKLVRSRQRIIPALRFLAKRGARRLLARVPLRLRSSILRGSMDARVHHFFDRIAENGTLVSLVFSDGDPGLMELHQYFGPGGRDLHYPNVSVSVLPAADHNLTTTRASTWLLDHMIAFAASTPVSPRVETSRERVPAADRAASAEKVA